MASSRKTILNLQTADRLMGRPDPVGLVEWISSSDEPAAGKFYTATNELLFGLLLFALRDPALAEEVLSRVYMEVRQEAVHFDQRRMRLLVWLVTIAHWHAIEHLRASKTGEQLAGLIGSDERSLRALKNFGINRSEHQRLVLVALAALSPAQLQMVELAYFSRMAPMEIALRLGLRLETVRIGLQEAMSRLCRLFKSDFPANTTKKHLPRVA